MWSKLLRMLAQFLLDVADMLDKTDVPEPEPETISIIEEFIPVGRKNRPGYAMAPKYITIHNTGSLGAGSDAKAHSGYIRSDSAANAPVSWHYTVDDKVVYQHLPTSENGWHSGDGSGDGNRKSIGVEICQHSDGDGVKIEENAQKLVAWLVENVDSLLPFPECMKQHFDWSGKNCPSVIRARPNGWALFIEGVEKYIGKVVRK